MSGSIYFLAPTQDRARQVVAQIKQMDIEFGDISVIDERSEVKRIAHPESDELRNAINGSVAGAVIGLLYGAATLAVIGARFIPGLLGASLILGYAAFGGVMFGAIIGSTGLFAKSRTPLSVLISVELLDPTERDRLVSAMNNWGASEIHHAGESAA